MDNSPLDVINISIVLQCLKENQKMAAGSNDTSKMLNFYNPSFLKNDATQILPSNYELYKYGSLTGFFTR